MPLSASSCRCRSAAIGAQHALDQFRHHGEPERISAPARLLDGLLEALLAKKDLGIMSRARAGIFVNAFLHQESGLPVDEVGQRFRIADRRAAAEKVEKPQESLRNGRWASYAAPVQTTPDQSSNFKG